MSNEFIPARGFEALADQGRRVVLKSGLWFSVFDNEEDALSFARYVGGFVRRVIAGANTRAFAAWSKVQHGFIAKLSIQFPGWGREEGVVVGSGGQVAGIMLEEKDGLVLLPIKPHHFFARTESGTLYIGFADGTAFCRSKSDGAQRVAQALFFAKSVTDARLVQEHGGEVEVEGTPAAGLYPLYAYNANVTQGALGRLKFQPNAFRVGTKVKEVTFA